MAILNPNPLIDAKSGFCSETKIFHSLRPEAPLPPETIPVSIADYAFSHFRKYSSPETTALIDSDTGYRLSYSEFIFKNETLAASLQTLIGLSKGEVAFIISPASLQIPILYFALFSIGVIISPANPSSTETEISRQIDLCKPVIAFATSVTAHKLPSHLNRIVLLDSPDFLSMMTSRSEKFERIKVLQSDTATILYSSGTTGQVKGVMLTHRNLIAMVAGYYTSVAKRASPAVVLYTVPYFHAYGFCLIVKSVAIGDTVVVLQSFEMRKMLKTVELFSVTHVVVAPPVVVALVKDAVAIEGYDLSSLELVICGGAPLGKEVIERLKKMLPGVLLAQGYGLTESTAGAFRLLGPDECRQVGSSGRLIANCEVKIVDPNTGIALPPCKQGELWIRGSTIMKGYIGNEAAATAPLNSEGWFKTGDLCYIDNDGFMFVVDRLKELIKYKGYQVPPAELELLLQTHPDIIDTAVIPYPDEAAGQVPMAFVVKRPQSTVDEAQVKAFIARQVAPYKKIRRVAFTDSIPKNAAGKILRTELIKRAYSSHSSKL